MSCQIVVSLDREENGECERGNELTTVAPLSEKIDDCADLISERRSEIQPKLKIHMTILDILHIQMMLKKECSHPMSRKPDFSDPLKKHLIG